MLLGLRPCRSPLSHTGCRGPFMSGRGSVAGRGLNVQRLALGVASLQDRPAVKTPSHLRQRPNWSSQAPGGRSISTQSVNFDSRPRPPFETALSTRASLGLFVSKVAAVLSPTSTRDGQSSLGTPCREESVRWSRIPALIIVPFCPQVCLASRASTPKSGPWPGTLRQFSGHFYFAPLVSDSAEILGYSRSTEDSSNLQ